MNPRHPSPPHSSRAAAFQKTMHSLWRNHGEGVAACRGDRGRDPHPRLRSWLESGEIDARLANHAEGLSAYANFLVSLIGV
jgi:hypothetical protein